MLAEALVGMANDRGLQTQLRAKGLARAAQFTWERTAERLLAAALP